MGQLGLGWGGSPRELWILLEGGMGGNDADPGFEG